MFARWRRGSQITVGLILAGAIGISPARATDGYKPDPELVSAARKEGQVIWYTTLIVDQIVRPLIKAFQAQFRGIDVKYVRGNSTQLVVRLINEARAGRVQADIWHVTDGVHALVQEGAAAKFDLPSAMGLPPEFLDPHRRWIATNLSTRSLAYNTQLVPKEQAPRSYQDLLDPRWKGKLVWHPNSMAGSMGFIATVLKFMGEEKGMNYLRALAKQNVTPLPIAARAVLDRVIAGEYPIGLEMTSSHAAISAAKGAPVRWVPLDAVSTTLQVGGIVAGGPHPHAAKLLLDFIVARAGQAVFRDADYLPMHPDVPAKMPVLNPKQASYKVFVFSPEEVDANAGRWVKIYDDLFR